MHAHPITSRDGATSELRVVAGARQSSPRDLPGVLVMPALGTPAAYYDPFALALAERGFNVVVGEHRGTGTSSVRATRKHDYGYVDVLREDWPAIIEATQSIIGHSPTFVGHSIGGQLGCLYEAEHPGTFERMALVAACSVHWRGWSGARQYVLLGQVTLVAAVAAALGHYPGERIGFGGRQGARLMRDWSRQARSGVYAPTSAPIDYEAALREVRARILSVSIRGDGLAPRAACDRLLTKMLNATVERSEIDANWQTRKSTDAHFRWAREPSAMLETLAPFLSA